MKAAAALGLFFALALVPPAIAQTPAMWSVSDADTTIYLFGGVHASSEGTDWLAGDIRAAYDASGEVVLEAVVTDPGKAAATAERLGKSAGGLQSQLTRSLSDKLATSLARVGARPGALDPYKAWYANTLMSIVALSGSSLNRSGAVEAVLQDRAARDGKRLIGLETVEEQFAAFDSIPVEAQARQLGKTLDDPAALRDLTETKVKCWASGNIACVEAEVDREYAGLPEVRDALLVHRNARWAGWIAERMKRPGVVFVAVGVDHFVGAGGLIEQLARNGVTAARVASR